MAATLERVVPWPKKFVIKRKCHLIAIVHGRISFELPKTQDHRALGRAGGCHDWGSRGRKSTESKDLRSICEGEGEGEGKRGNIPLKVEGKGGDIPEKSEPHHNTLPITPDRFRDVHRS